MSNAKQRESAIAMIECACKHVLVVQWYDKDDLEELLDEEITDAEYQKIIDEWMSYDIIQDTVIDYANDILREMRGK